MSTMTTSPRIALLEETCARHFASEEVKIALVFFLYKLFRMYLYIYIYIYIRRI